MCLAQGHNTVTLVRLEPAAPQSQIKHSTTEPLLSLKNIVIELTCSVVIVNIWHECQYCPRDLMVNIVEHV